MDLLPEKSVAVDKRARRVTPREREERYVFFLMCVSCDYTCTDLWHSEIETLLPQRRPPDLETLEGGAHTYNVPWNGNQGRNQHGNHGNRSNHHGPQDPRSLERALHERLGVLRKNGNDNRGSNGSLQSLPAASQTVSASRPEQSYNQHHGHGFQSSAIGIPQAVNHSANLNQLQKNASNAGTQIDVTDL